MGEVIELNNSTHNVLENQTEKMEQWEPVLQEADTIVVQTNKNISKMIWKECTGNCVGRILIVVALVIFFFWLLIFCGAFDGAFEDYRKEHKKGEFKDT